eukprot:5938437-Pyramimonas_sp.AAC.1
MQLVSTASGSLPGRQQSVPRGEMFMFLRAVQWASDYVVHITDNQAVYDGWYAHLDQKPAG